MDRDRAVNVTGVEVTEAERSDDRLSVTTAMSVAGSWRYCNGKVEIQLRRAMRKKEESPRHRDDVSTRTARRISDGNLGARRSSVFGAEERTRRHVLGSHSSSA